MTIDITTLTANEKAAALVLLQECLNGMGGKTPDDLKDDPYTWCDSATLIAGGWTAAEAAGTYGSLIAKGIVTQLEGEPCDVLDGWEEVATLWDSWMEAGKDASVIRGDDVVEEDEASKLISGLVAAGAAEEAAKAMGIPFPGIICATLRSHAFGWVGSRKAFIATAQLAGFNKATAATQWQRARTSVVAEAFLAAAAPEGDGNGEE